MLAVKRTRRRAGLFVVVFLVVALLSGLAVALSGYLAGSATAGTRAGVAALTGADGGFRVTIPLAADATGQDARVRASVHDLVRSGGRAVPMTVTRDVETADPIEFDPAAGTPVHSIVAAVPGLASRATLVEGRWPTSPAEASMQADAARSFGVHAGERLTLLDGSVLTISALWRVRDSTDPFWLGDPIPLHGVSDDGTAGWIVVAPSVMPAVKGHPTARWTIRPAASHLTAAQLTALAAAPDVVSNALSADPRNHNAVDEDGLLDLAIRPIEQNVQSAIAASTAPLVIVAVLGLVMLVELGRLLEALRSEENALLRARGSSGLRFGATTAGEATVVAVPAGVVAVALVVVSNHAIAADVPVAGWIAAAVPVIAAIVSLALAAGRSTRRSEPASSRSRSVLGSRRVRAGVGAGVVVLLALAAVLAVSQFLLYGSPLAPDAAGGTSVDPLAVSAPALAVAAIGLLAVAAFPLLGRVARGPLRRIPSLRWLPVAQLVRRPRAAAAPILVLCFAISALVVAAGYSGTWSVSSAETRGVHVGTALRIAPTGDLDADVTRSLPGQTDAAPTAVTDVQLGDSLVTLVASPADRMARLLTPVPGAVDPAVLARRLKPVDVRPVIPRSAAGVVLRFTAVPATATPSSADLIVADAAGAVTDIIATTDADGFHFTLPHGLAPFTVQGIDVELPLLKAGATVDVRLSSERGSTAAIPLGDSWKPSDDSDTKSALTGLGGGRAGLRAVVDGGGIRVLLESVRASGAPLPVVVSSGLADAAGLAVGSTTLMHLDTLGGQVPVIVAAISPAIPGTATGDGVLADLGELQRAVLREGLRGLSANEWWVATARPARALSTVTARVPSDTRLQTMATTPADQVLQSAQLVIWVAGGATALLALLSIAAVLLVELRSRRGEVRLLRALGVDARDQGRDRAVEWSALLGLGLVVGLADGFITALLLVRGLARTAIADAIPALPTMFRIDPVGGGVAFVAMLVALAGLVLVAVLTVRGQTSESSAR